MLTSDEILSKFSSIGYVKKFAFLPVKCVKSIVWLRPYYRKYKVYNIGRRASLVFFIENITEADCIIEKLTGAN